MQKNLFMALQAVSCMRTAADKDRCERTSSDALTHLIKTLRRAMKMFIWTTYSKIKLTCFQRQSLANI